MKNGEHKEIASSVRELSRSSKEFGSAVNGTVRAVKPLKNLIGEPGPENDNTSSRLIAAGIALIALPDPTITDVIGTSMVVAGLIKNKTKKTTMSDADRSFRDAMKKLEKMTREITIL